MGARERRREELSIWRVLESVVGAATIESSGNECGCDDESAYLASWLRGAGSVLWGLLERCILYCHVLSTHTPRAACYLRAD